jgi:hypothetical protein
MEDDLDGTVSPASSEGEQDKYQKDEVGVFLEDLEGALRRSPELRSLAARLTGWLGGVLSTVAAEEESSSVAGEEDAVIGEAATEDVEPRKVQLNLGPAQAVIEVSGEGAEVPEARPVDSVADRESLVEEEGALPVQAPVDVDRLMSRARLVGECCRWAIQRRKRIEAGEDFGETIRPRDRELGRMAEELEIFPWPLDSYVSLPSDAELGVLGCCYENMAVAIEFAREVRHDEELGPVFIGDAYQLLAEAQSALRSGLRRYVDRGPDAVQEAAFRWLSRRTSRDHVYVNRYMRLTDAADPGDWHELQQKIEHVRTDREGQARATRLRSSLLGKVRYHAQRVEKAGDDGDIIGDWNRINEAVGGLIEGSLPPSNVALRDILLPVVDRIPESFEVGIGLQRVLTATDRFLATRELEGSKALRPPEPSEEVKRVAERLRGKTVVLIGGQERPRSREALEKAFELGSLRWISAASGVSYTTFEPAIARPETVLVILAIRWSSHSFSHVNELCQRHEKLFVRLPAGYNPNQVARQVLEQVGDRLCR